MLTIPLGIGAIFWFFLRVVPKPSRASYPCQRIAATTALGFVAWLVGIGGFAALFRKTMGHVRRAPVAAALVGSVIVAGGGAWMLFAQPSTPAHAYTTWVPTEGVNAPMGVARGINPGRVVWAYDPLATKWDAATGHWWDPASTDQARVDAMLSKSLKALTGKTTDEDAWSVLFSSFNQRHARTGGYAAGQKIVIKINQNTARGGHAADGLTTGDQNPINGNPHVILALLRQLVNHAKVVQDDIIVYDVSRYIGDNIFVPCNAEFANVHFIELATGGGQGREAFDNKRLANALTFAGQGVGRDLPQFVVQAAYMINLASLKAHGDDAGPTLHAKNHYGTVTGLNHTWPNTKNTYSFFVELMGSKYLGENTFLFMIDGLYGAPGADASPARFSSYPFSGNWPSSLLLSQDGIASESVGWDFINAEWGVPPGSDNTLHEAATANAPGSGTKYAPNGDGVQLPSLGVHEHWNNAIEKKYSRNLGAGNGIELVQLISADAPIPLPRNGWIVTASNNGDVPSNMIDGKLGTRWTTGAARAAGQWIQIDMGAAQPFSQIVLDANGSTDYVGGYEVLVSSDGVDWGSPVATGTATASKTVITFPSQTARFVKIVATDSGTKWWSVAELNLYGPAGTVSLPPVDAGVVDSGTADSGGAPGSSSSGATSSEPTSSSSSGGATSSGFPSSGSGDAGTDGQEGEGSSGGCGCGVASSSFASPWIVAALVVVGISVGRRSRRAAQPRTSAGRPA